MASNTFNLVSLLILISFLKFAAIQGQGPTYLYDKCSENRTTTANSAFETNLKTLFSSLTSNATANTEFYNTTVTGRNPSDTVYGMFMCRGDHSSCGQGVLNATQRISSDPTCSLSKEGVIWYDECMVRYSDNRSIFSTVATRPGVFLLNTANISNQASFMRLLFKTMNETADEAARSPVLAKKYATKEANISGFQNLYCMAQCTDDLSPQGCRSCLSDAIGDLPKCCDGKQGGRVLFPSCFVRYELYPFYQSTASAPAPSPAGLVPPPPGLVPTTNSSNSGGNCVQNLLSSEKRPTEEYDGVILNI